MARTFGGFRDYSPGLHRTFMEGPARGVFAVLAPPPDARPAGFC